MFIGEYSHVLDAKGRMFMPAKFRDELGEKFIVTIGLDRCLFVFPTETFQIYKEKLDAISLANRDARNFTRFFFAGAGECELDKQGRIMLPQKLRTYARLEKDVTVVGVSGRIELWNTEDWEKEHSIENFSPDEFSEKMELLGF
ncbi:MULTISPECIES: division/cell wall cluster transcriptional repressor MraZ [Congzhengia]|jgi:MraZ protein|uniref:Transcriptional regulator MraZ n=1 Tax=Congzhengia minquanensis TaxID=2763657 RepID=A0A926HYX8_9FIRM|nr:division/cell wall cluster transcriptional repressor MraZ [Congzhengia minquanensis]MBC8540261.1 division/cell wall cluster transcriptional repressor MraZ [Congzhengia minquanensis]MBD8947858.1 transcriptional regulator MraZ [Clostridiales bacterium]MBD8948052.1 transcriptional regulator MraZ [Clostridiales bacterium]HBL83046.1 cell division/cell wall cluster transcriptional repressor MraZ [Clostridiales bacterium]